MKRLILSLICIIAASSVYGQSVQKNSDINIPVANAPLQKNSVASLPDQNDTLKIKYIPEKVWIADTTLQQQKEWMKKWEIAVKENRQKDAIEALEKASNYKSGEAYYKLAELYKTGNGVKKDPVQACFLFNYSAFYGYKPGIDWLNSGEGVFLAGTNNSLPQFPGGEKALMRYINNKAREAFKSPNGMVEFQGRVVVLFIVEKDGSIRHVKIMRNSCSEFIEKYIISMFKDMPKWKPALWEGQPIRCFFTCPVLIKLGM